MGSAVTYVGVGTCSLTAHVAAGTNFAAANGTAQTFTIGQGTPTTPTISNLPASGAVGGGFTATVSTTGDGTKSVTSNATSICTVSGFAVTYVGVGTCSLTAHVAAGTNFAAANGTAQTFTIGQGTPTTPTISNLPASGAVGGGFTATVSTTGDGTKSVTSNATSICTVSGFAVTYVGVGTCSLTAHVAAGTNLAAANGTAQTFTITAAPAPYSPLAPVRICDTRAASVSGLTGATAQCNGNTIAAGTVRTINVANSANGGLGSFGVPATATAVMLNVTVVNPAGPGHVTAFPAGTNQPTASNINYQAGENIPGLVDVGVGTGGDVSFFSLAQTDMVVDVEGYTAPTASGGAGSGLYNALSSPVRICDTRPGNPSNLSGMPYSQCNGGSGNPGDTLTAGKQINVEVVGASSGSTSIPTGATAAVLNVTAANTSSNGHLTVFPTGSQQPTASNVNYVAGRVSANRVVVPLSTTGSSAGSVTIYSSAQADVVVDVAGYFSAPGASSGSQFTAENAPVRICDTRAVSVTTPSNQCSNNPVVAGAANTLKVNVANLAGVPQNATAVVINLTAVTPTVNTFLSVFPGLTPPGSSDLNPAAGETRANMVIATINQTTGQITIYNNSGTTNVIVDVLGWYS